MRTLNNNNIIPKRYFKLKTFRNVILPLKRHLTNKMQNFCKLSGKKFYPWTQFLFLSSFSSPAWPSEHATDWLTDKAWNPSRSWNAETPPAWPSLAARDRRRQSSRFQSNFLLLSSTARSDAQGDAVKWRRTLYTRVGVCTSGLTNQTVEKKMFLKKIKLIKT